MIVTPKGIVDAIEARMGIAGSPRQLRDAVERELLDASIPPTKAAEDTDRLRSKVAAEITRRRDEGEGRGEIAVLHLRGAQNDIVVGSSVVFADDVEEIRITKLNRLHADKLIAAIRKLKFDKFEVFGRCVLREIGCHKANVTQHAGDQGIDFYGEITVGSLLNAHKSTVHLMHHTRVVIVGQAKHYPTRPIGTSTVRELVGALSLSRTATFSSDIDLLDGVQLKPFSPVLAMLFSTGDFTSGARQLAARAGLIVFSGWQLAVFLADKGIGLVTENDALDFSQTEFDRWLAFPNEEI